MIVETSFGGVRAWTGHDLAALVKHANNRKLEFPSTRTSIVLPPRWDTGSRSRFGAEGS
jgi:hypothetical protein